MRYALQLEYDGSNYCGWERQLHGESVQVRVETALSTIAAMPVHTVCAGRTDSGVHALGQVVHFDSEAQRPEKAWCEGANAKLPPDISVLSARRMDPSFHARFSATCRHYRYLICNRPTRPAVLASRAAWRHQGLDAGLMQAAAAFLCGNHDFSAFRASRCQAPTARRTIYRAEVRRKGECIIIDVAANAFLHHMVRNIVGSLMVVGEARRSPQWMGEVLEGRDRKLAGPTAPAQGLYLTGVDYPARFALARVSPISVLW